jgi:hypothetical protein
LIGSNLFGAHIDGAAMNTSVWNLKIRRGSKQKTLSNGRTDAAVFTSG